MWTDRAITLCRAGTRQHVHTSARPQVDTLWGADACRDPIETLTLLQAAATPRPDPRRRRHAAPRVGRRGPVLRLYRLHRQRVLCRRRGRRVACAELCTTSDASISTFDDGDVLRRRLRRGQPELPTATASDTPTGTPTGTTAATATDTPTCYTVTTDGRHADRAPPTDTARRPSPPPRHRPSRPRRPARRRPASRDRHRDRDRHGDRTWRPRPSRRPRRVTVTGNGDRDRHRDRPGDPYRNADQHRPGDRDVDRDRSGDGVTHSTAVPLDADRDRSTGTPNRDVHRPATATATQRHRDPDRRRHRHRRRHRIRPTGQHRGVRRDVRVYDDDFQIVSDRATVSTSTATCRSPASR